MDPPCAWSVSRKCSLLSLGMTSLWSACLHSSPRYVGFCLFTEDIIPLHSNIDTIGTSMNPCHKLKKSPTSIILPGISRQHWIACLLGWERNQHIHTAFYDPWANGGLISQLSSRSKWTPCTFEVSLLQTLLHQMEMLSQANHHGHRVRAAFRLRPAVYARFQLFILDQTRTQCSCLPL